jgi:hypothetical protein
VSDVGDGTVRRRCRVNREVYPPDDALMRAPVVATLHVDANDFRDSGVGEHQQQRHAHGRLPLHSRHSHRR